MLVKYREGTSPRPRACVEPSTADELRANVAKRLDVFDITGALDADLGPRPAAEQARHRHQAVGAREGRGERRELDRVLYTLADGLRATSVALAAYVPETSQRILEALGQPDDVAWENVAVGKTAAAERHRGCAAALPAPRGPARRDRHPCAPRRVRGPPNELFAARTRAASEGSSRSARRSSAELRSTSRSTTTRCS